MNKALLYNIKKGVSFFLSHISWKKILTFSVFILIATILWFMQIYNKQFETTISIPIKYTIPDSIVIQNTLPNNIKLKIKDNGIAMFAYRYFRKDSIKINAGNLIKGSANSRILLQGAALDQYIRNAISDKSQVLNYSPVLINLSYAPLAQKKLPVIFDGTIDLSTGYLLSKDITVTPDSIVVYGDQKELNKLLYVYTDRDTIKNVDSDKVISVDLTPMPHVRTIVNSVNVSINVEAYVQQSIDIPVQCVNLPNHEAVKFFPSKVKVVFYCGVSQLTSVKAEDFIVVVDYQSLKESDKATVPVRITHVPDYARNITIIPSDVEFIFEHR